MRNPHCETPFAVEHCTPGEVRLVPKTVGEGYQFLCRGCFEAEVAWRRSGCFYDPAFNPEPAWDKLKVWNPNPT